MHRPIARLACAIALLATVVPAQVAEPVRLSGPLTLEAAIAYAIQNYPSIRAAQADVDMAESGIGLAKTAYLPEAGMRLGVNRATRNNVFGLIFPNTTIPGISGPVQSDSTITSVFGSSAGVSFSYEPFDFGLRQAHVRVAQAARMRAEAGRAVTEHDVALAAADAYIRTVANRLAVQAAEANVRRMQVFRDSVGALVQSGLRPGADASRTEAELVRSRSELIRAEQAARAALASLAESLGLAGSAIEIDAANLMTDPPELDGDGASIAAHPLAAAQQAEVAVDEARIAARDKEWRPKFRLEAATFGRGTGALINGEFLGGAHGLAPTAGNWAVGFNLDFDLLAYKRIRVQKQLDANRLERDRAREATVAQQLRGAEERALIAVDTARRIARNTPVELTAAQALETQTGARYQAGLGTVSEVADAQRLLRQAEVDDSLARLGIWRAAIALAAARGEIVGWQVAGSR